MLSPSPDHHASYYRVPLDAAVAPLHDRISSADGGLHLPEGDYLTNLPTVGTMGTAPTTIIEGGHLRIANGGPKPTISFGYYEVVGTGRGSCT